MDINLFLALPDTFKRDVMKRVEFTPRKRLTMRKECRGFERLMAETHAGICDRGRIELGDKIAFIIIGDLEMNTYTSSEAKLDQFHQSRTRLFSGITIDRFRILLDDKDYSLQFILNFTENFQAEE
ncbi:hypothetical protein PENTCL1PPCAC_13594, partial [Pristionchus entomophagus]